VVDSADHGGLGDDLDVSAEQAGTEDRPAEGGLVEDEVPSERTGVRIRVDRQRPVQRYPQGIPADREESPHRVRDLVQNTLLAWARS